MALAITAQRSNSAAGRRLLGVKITHSRAHESPAKCRHYRLQPPPLWGNTSVSVTAVPEPRRTQVSAFRQLTCRNSSRHRPQGARISPPEFTATILPISDSRDLSMSATAACPAQKPRLQAVSMQTLVKTRPVRVTRAAATPPATQSALVRNSPTSRVAMRIKSSSVMFITKVQSHRPEPNRK